MPPQPKKRPAPATKQKKSSKPAANPPQKKVKPKGSQTKSIPGKSKPAQKDPSKKKEKSIPKKKGGMFSKLIKLTIFVGVLAGGYYAYLMYKDIKSKGQDFTYSNVKNSAGDTGAKWKKNVNAGINKVKEQGKIVWDATAEDRLKFMEMSKDSWSSLEKKVKEIGEVSSEELGNMADGYMDDFNDMVQTTDSTSGGTKEVVAYKGKDYTDEVLSEKEKERLAKDRKNTLNNQKNDLKTPPRVNKRPDTTKPKNDEKFVKPSIKKNKPNAADKPVNKSGGGLTLTDKNIGKTDKAAIRKNRPRPKIAKKSKPTPPKSEPAHMKKYYEGRKLFLEGVSHFKKASPSSPQKQRRKHNKLAYKKFKKASKIFQRIARKMGDHKEFEKISMDTVRFHHACGKTMLISDH